MTAVDRIIRAGFAGLLGRFSLNVAFTTPMRGITALFGPSGSGKTTTLRCIAGLQHLAGKLTVGAEIWQEDSACIFRKPHQRSIGYVFQEPSLFPHLSVRRNLLYGARRAIRDGGVQPISEDDVIDLLGLGQLLDRSPHALSGGERQRVAVGRALLSQPRLLLMDEPLAALDRATKDDILPYFEALHGALSVPILYVSHDMAEVERLADHLVLLDQGRVIASGPLSELEAEPSLPLLAGSGGRRHSRRTDRRRRRRLLADELCRSRRHRDRAGCTGPAGRSAQVAHQRLRCQLYAGAAGAHDDPQLFAGARRLGDAARQWSRPDECGRRARR